MPRTSWTRERPSQAPMGSLSDSTTLVDDCLNTLQPREHEATYCRNYSTSYGPSCEQRWAAQESHLRHRSPGAAGLVYGSIICSRRLPLGRWMPLLMGIELLISSPASRLGKARPCGSCDVCYWSQASSSSLRPARNSPGGFRTTRPNTSSHTVGFPTIGSGSPSFPGGFLHAHHDSAGVLAERHPDGLFSVSA
jgi:hypothetical protein